MCPGESDAPAPRVALTVAVTLTVVTVLLIMAQRDHLSRGLQVGEVVRSIAEEGEDVLAGMSLPSGRSRPAATASDGEDRFTFAIAAPRAGWVTRAVSERILAAVPAGTTVRLETRVGAYIHRGEVLAALTPTPTHHDRGDTTAVRHRADRQDPNHAGGSRLRDPSAGRRRAAGAEQTAFPQSQVIAALLRVLRMLIAHVEAANRPEHLPVLRRQLQLVLAALAEETRLLPDDLDRLRAIGDGSTDPAEPQRLARPATPPRKLRNVGNVSPSQMSGTAPGPQREPRR